MAQVDDLVTLLSNTVLLEIFYTSAKTSDFHISLESRQREPNQTNETKIFSLSFIYSRK